MADSVASLVARVVTEDDRTAFELLVRRYQSPLRNFLRRLARNDIERAEALARKALLNLYTSIDTYKGQAAFTEWLYHAAYDAFLDDERKLLPQTEIDEASRRLTADGAPSPSSARDVDAALLRLSVRQQAVFDLHYKKGLTRREVAGALELLLETVESELTHGRDKLKDILAGVYSGTPTGDSVDSRMDAALLKPEPALGDDGFSDDVMDRLPRKRLGSTKARRWTLGLAAAMGSFVASLLSAPIESVFSGFVLDSGYEMVLVGTSVAFLFFGLIAIPVTWAFYSK